MTYCVAMRLNTGLVFLSDSRTNAGLDQISTFRKMTVYEQPGDRVMVMLSAGNLAITQAVKQLLNTESIDSPEGPVTIWNARSLFDCARIVGSAVRKVTPIEWCGVEDMTLEQTQDLWISTIEFTHAWNCWVRGVRVVKTGRFPVQTNRGKWCEVRDCIFDDAWFKGGGGTAYSAWQNSWDCLMDGIETFNYRHAPLVQWAASGCVIRNGVFHKSDGQWHAGWSNENLFENCAIDSRTGNGGYGYGLWASPPEDTAHGPNGPRNVVYNCAVASQKDGLWMGGMNENWLILYNRFVVEKGAGVFAKTASFDHIIAGNVFVLRDTRAAVLDLRTPDCSGIEALGNIVYGGSGRLCAGLGRLARDEGNVLKPAQPELPARPTPAVPSIFQWQRDQVKWERRLPVR